MADPKIKYDIAANVTGDVEVGALASKMEALAATLEGDLKTSALDAATALRELGAKNDAATAFFELKQRATDAAASLADAQAKAQALAREIAASGAPTRTQAGQMAKLGDAVGAAKLEVLASTQALEAGRGTLTQYGLSTDGLAKSQASMKSELGLAKIQAQAMTGQYGTLATGAASAAAGAEKAAAGTHAMGAATVTLSGRLRTMAPLMAATFTVDKFLAAITSAETLDRTYTQLFGSVAKANDEMEFIKETSNKLGVDTLGLARSYQVLAASTKNTTLEGQQTRDVFEAVTRAMSTLGKSSAETDQALNAVSQMASKGTVSMEELRKQLGDTLPGAMKAAADGAGITVEQLAKMVSEGRILSKDMLPALTKGLNALYGSAAPPATVLSEWARWKNQIDEVNIAYGKQGGNEGLAAALRWSAEAYGTLANAAVKAGEKIGGAAFEITQVTKIAADYKNGQITLAQALAALGLTTQKTKEEQLALAKAQQATSDSANELYRHQGMLNREMAAASEGAALIEVRYDRLRQGSADFVAQLDKEIKARDAEGAVLTKLVNIYGTEIEKRQVAASVAQTQAASEEKLASAQNTAVLIANSYVLKLQDEAKATKDTSVATQDRIIAAQKVAAAMQTEFETTDALAKAKRIEAEASKAQAQATQDNSARVYEYRGAVAQAATEVDRLTKLQQQGKATSEQVTEAMTKLASATLLYRDALADASAKAETQLLTDQRAAALGREYITVEQERVKAAIEVANAQGDVTKATQLGAQATTLQVQASQAAGEAARAEAQDIRDLADKKEAEYRAIGQLTEAQKQDLEARRQSADMKDLDAQKSDILTQKLVALAKATDTGTAALEAQNAAIERANAANEKAIELENKRLNRDKEGFSLDTGGNRVNMLIQTQRSVYDQAKSQGLSEADSLKIAKQFISDNGQKQGWDQQGAAQGKNWGTALQEAIDKLVLANAAKNAGTDASGNPLKAPGGGVITTVIDLRTDAGTFSVPTNDGGAQAMLAALKAAKGVAA